MNGGMLREEARGEAVPLFPNAKICIGSVIVGRIFMIQFQRAVVPFNQATDARHRSWFQNNFSKKTKHEVYRAVCIAQQGAG